MIESVAPGFLDAIAHRFRIEAVCGRGGTSVVYRARDVRNDQLVALKVFRPELTAAMGTERFLREVHIAHALVHPHIVSALESGEQNGVLYSVLTFVDGETLRSRLAREGALPLEEALRLTRQIGDALSYAHAHGIVHRDVKPENILLSGGRALLGDFGIARAIVVAAGDRLTDSGIVIGTPAYMSPEQATADAALDARTDQYALAVCLYEMIAGDPPFTARTSQALIARLVAEPPPPLETVRPTVPLGVVAAIEQAMAKVPADRFASVEAFLAAVESPTAKLNRPVRYATRQRPWRAAAVALVAVAAVIAAWVATRRPLDASRVLVFPARTAAVGSDPREGLRIADAIQIAVEHTEPLRWIPAWESLDSATRADPSRLRAADARALARRRGSRFYVLSAVEASASGTQVMIWLHDAAGDSVVTQVSALDSTGAVPATALAIRALPRLLASMLDPGARVDLSPLSDRRLPAIVKLFEAEEAYRSARFGAAFALYREAVDADPAFAYAALKGAQAASWENRLEEATDLLRSARENEQALPPKYRPFLAGLEAYQGGRADSAVAGFQRALAFDRYWAEAAMALGDVYYHLIPSATSLDSLAEASFAAAVAIDSTFLPPLFHLAEISVLRGDVRVAAQYGDRMVAAGAQPSSTQHLATMLRCVQGRMTDADWQTMAALTPDAAMLAARSLAVGARQPACAERGARAVLAAPAASAGTVWASLLTLHGVLVATGRSREAAQLLDSARTHISSRAFAFALTSVYVDSAVVPLARAAEAFGQERFGTHYAGARPRSAWAFGVWEAWQRDTIALRAIATRLDSVGRATSDAPTLLAAASLAAHLTLLRGDTSAALQRFAALPTTAPRDSLSWEFLEPIATDRLTYASVLLATGRTEEALQAAAVFDHPQPVAFVSFVRRSLELRIDAATQLGRPALVSTLRRRLRALDRAVILSS